MIIFENLSEQEQLFIDQEYDQHLIACKLQEVLDFLHDNMLAHHYAWRIASGNYLINTPQDIADYCIDWANENQAQFYTI